MQILEIPAQRKFISAGKSDYQYQFAFQKLFKSDH